MMVTGRIYHVFHWRWSADYTPLICFLLRLFSSELIPQRVYDLVFVTVGLVQELLLTSYLLWVVSAAVGMMIRNRR